MSTRGQVIIDDGKKAAAIELHWGDPLDLVPALAKVCRSALRSPGYATGTRPAALLRALEDEIDGIAVQGVAPCPDALLTLHVPYVYLVEPGANAVRVTVVDVMPENMARAIEVTADASPEAAFEAYQDALPFPSPLGCVEWEALYAELPYPDGAFRALKDSVHSLHRYSADIEGRTFSRDIPPTEGRRALLTLRIGGQYFDYLNRLAQHPGGLVLRPGIGQAWIFSCIVDGREMALSQTRQQVELLVRDGELFPRIRESDGTPVPVVFDAVPLQNLRPEADPYFQEEDG